MTLRKAVLAMCSFLLLLTQTAPLIHAEEPEVQEGTISEEAEAVSAAAADETADTVIVSDVEKEETVTERAENINTAASPDDEVFSSVPAPDEEETPEISENEEETPPENTENGVIDAENNPDPAEELSENDQLTSEEADGEEETDISEETDEISDEELPLAGSSILTAEFTASDNSTYEVNVTYTGTDERFDTATLSVEEVLVSDEKYDEYVEQTADAIGSTVEEIHYIKLLDISILDEDGEEMTFDGSVDVQIRLLEQEEVDDSTQIVHFGEEQPEIVESTVEGDAVAFSAESFSVYAIVAAPMPVSPDGYITINNVSELSEHPILIGNLGYYFRSVWHTVGGRNLIKKTAVNEIGNAAEYYFEPTGTANNTFKVYTGIGESKQYVVMSGIDSSRGGLALSYNEEDAMEFTVLPFPNTPGCFQVSGTVSGTTYYWNMQGGTGGNGYAAYYAKDDKNNKLTFIYANEIEDDPYGFGGNNYAIVRYNTTKVVGAALGTETTSDSVIQAQSVVGRLEFLDEFDGLMVASDSEAALWTFHNVIADKYMICSNVNGVDRYLCRKDGKFSFTDNPDENCYIQVIPGTDENAGKVVFRLSDGSYLANVGADANKGIVASTGRTADCWFYLAEATGIEDEDFVVTTATKVSVSEIQNNQRVIVYARYWNNKTKTYDMYMIDKDGSLMRCYDNGDSIIWVGTKFNTIYWDFLEYYYEGTTTPNYYYDLRNAYSDKYLAPQINGQILSDDPIGITLNGRRYGEYYSTILAWDDPNYDYASLRIADRNLAAAAMSLAEDFYFALAPEPETEDHLTTVETIDNNEFGITMKMQNYPYAGYYPNGNRNLYRSEMQGNVLGMNTGSGGSTEFAGLLERNIDPATGYPLTVSAKTGEAQQSLSALYSDTTPANHLFLKTRYQESGYFEYDCTKTFAHLITPEEDPANAGNFRVYDQIGTSEYSSKATLKHGQFLPYNDIHEGEFATKNPTNQTDITGKPLPGTDPRYGEVLYGIPATPPDTAGTPQHPIYTKPGEVDYFFGMELEASFMQSRSGLDAWNHDLIFEFSGDDDFWLYVDGKLVIDLGGIHSAMNGDINFRTGIVHVNNKETTLRQQFALAYQEAGMSQAEIEAELDTVFKPGTSVFRDYTSHQMKMFYMERGASASNLHMKFNLIPVEPGQVFLEKDISGTDKVEYLSSRFPFQIFYKDPATDSFVQVTTDPNDPVSVYYKNSHVPVESEASYEGYNDVFFLRPKQTVSIFFPEEETEYYIKEVGIDPTIYDTASANDEELTPIINGTAYDYQTSTSPVSLRKNVSYNNHVSQNALRTLNIRKRLYNEDMTAELQSTDPTRSDFDDTAFQFRMFLGEDLDYYRLGKYYVRDPQGNYCRYDSTLRKFVSLGTSVFDDLSEAQQEAATFLTSPSGAASRLPAGYSFEIRNLLPETKFRIEERPGDIPEGYKFVSYARINGSYALLNEGEYNAGTILARKEGEMEISNRRVWSLEAVKEWSDDSFMAEHGTIYYGVFANGNLISGTLRQMTTDQRKFRYVFETIEPGVTYADYHIREVLLTDPVADADGYITSYTNMTVLDDGDPLTVNCIKKGESTAYPTNYMVTYDSSEPSGMNNNVRTDTMTNARPGIKIVKTDWDGNPLSNAVFTLTDPLGENPGAESYTSKANGLIAVAYLDDGVAYTLQETRSPEGYAGLEVPVTITTSNGVVIATTDSEHEGYVSVTQGSGDTPAVITVKNRPMTFRAIKIDSENDPLPGAHFALYREVTSAYPPVKDFDPIPAYADLISENDGTIPLVNETLPRGVYYIAETEAPGGYEKLQGSIRFEIDDLGHITFTGDTPSMFSTSLDYIDGNPVYTLKIINIVGTAELEISKTVAGAGGNKTKQFDFTVHLENRDGTPFEGSVHYHGSRIGTIQFVNGEASFTLSHGESIVLERLKVGNHYIVTEADYSSDGYTTEYTDCRGAVYKNGSNARVVNRYDIFIPTGFYMPRMRIYVLLAALGALSFLMQKKRKKS